MLIALALATKPAAIDVENQVIHLISDGLNFSASGLPDSVFGLVEMVATVSIVSYCRIRLVEESESVYYYKLRRLQVVPIGHVTGRQVRSTASDKLTNRGPLL
jgi:hypothetical protein